MTRIIRDILHLDLLVLLRGHTVNLLVEIPAVARRARWNSVGGDVAGERRVLGSGLRHENAQVNHLRRVARAALHPVEEVGGLGQVGHGGIADVEEEDHDGSMTMLSHLLGILLQFKNELLVNAKE